MKKIAATIIVGLAIAAGIKGALVLNARRDDGLRATYRSGECRQAFGDGFLLGQVLEDAYGGNLKAPPSCYGSDPKDCFARIRTLPQWQAIEREWRTARTVQH
jgi:hypothetical protein